MQPTITYDEGHAHVAAIRVLTYRLSRPPTIEEIAEALGSKPEITNHRLRLLEELGIVVRVENPFNAHYSVRDHLALEKLPTEATGAGLADEVAEFQKRQEKKSEEFMKMFEELNPEKEKKEKYSKLEDDLKSFQKKKGSKKAPWE
jgi:DNA-binding transcriptional regulator GbsR (MarR family)